MSTTCRSPGDVSCRAWRARRSARLRLRRSRRAGGTPPRTAGARRPEPAAAGRAAWATRSQCRPRLLLLEVDDGLLQAHRVEQVDQLVAVELLADDEHVGDPLDRALVL